MAKIKFTRLIDNKSIILSSTQQTNIKSGEIVQINGYRYITNIIN